MEERDLSEQERIEKQLTDFDDPDRGPDDESVESGEEAIDEAGRNPTQQRIDAEAAGEGPLDDTAA